MLLTLEITLNQCAFPSICDHILHFNNIDLMFFLSMLLIPLLFVPGMAEILPFEAIIFYPLNQSL